MDKETIDAFERDYARGFNDGYVIAGNLPELASQLSHTSLESPWFEGFRDGREQYVQEKTRALHPSWLWQDRNKENRIEPTKDRGSETGRDQGQSSPSSGKLDQGPDQSGNSSRGEHQTPWRNRGEAGRNKGKDRDQER